MHAPGDSFAVAFGQFQKSFTPKSLSTLVSATGTECAGELVKCKFRAIKLTLGELKRIVKIWRNDAT